MLRTLCRNVALLLGITLAGSSVSYAGNVYARNPETGGFGPVCDDDWDINDVSTQKTSTDNLIPVANTRISDTKTPRVKIMRHKL